MLLGIAYLIKGGSVSRQETNKMMNVADHRAKGKLKKLNFSNSKKPTNIYND